jgi:hypothetical protein
MKGSIIVVAAAAAALAACGSGEADNGANAVANAAAAPKHPTYCFFKDAATKNWTVGVVYGGSVTVGGKARLDDARYRGELGQPEIVGTKARVWLTMAENHGYASPDSWWDVTFAIPDSTKVTDVTVMCGTKTVAELKVKR